MHRVPASPFIGRKSLLAPMLRKKGYGDLGTPLLGYVAEIDASNDPKTTIGSRMKERRAGGTPSIFENPPTQEPDASQEEKGFRVPPHRTEEHGIQQHVDQLNDPKHAYGMWAKDDMQEDPDLYIESGWANPSSPQEEKAYHGVFQGQSYEDDPKTGKPFHEIHRIDENTGEHDPLRRLYATREETENILTAEDPKIQGDYWEWTDDVLNGGRLQRSDLVQRREQSSQKTMSAINPLSGGALVGAKLPKKEKAERLPRRGDIVYVDTDAFGGGGSRGRVRGISQKPNRRLSVREVDAEGQPVGNTVNVLGGTHQTVNDTQAPPEFFSDRQGMPYGEQIDPKTGKEWKNITTPGAGQPSASGRSRPTVTVDPLRQVESSVTVAEDPGRIHRYSVHDSHETGRRTAQRLRDISGVEDGKDNAYEIIDNTPEDGVKMWVVKGVIHDDYRYALRGDEVAFGDEPDYYYQGEVEGIRAPYVNNDNEVVRTGLDVRRPYGNVAHGFQETEAKDPKTGKPAYGTLEERNKNFPNAYTKADDSNVRFSGTKKDSRGRKICFQEGHRVTCRDKDTEEERKTPRQAPGRQTQRGQARESHEERRRTEDDQIKTDRETRHSLREMRYSFQEILDALTELKQYPHQVGPEQLQNLTELTAGMELADLDQLLGTMNISSDKASLSERIVQQVLDQFAQSMEGPQAMEQEGMTAPPQVGQPVMPDSGRVYKAEGYFILESVGEDDPRFQEFMGNQYGQRDVAASNAGPEAGDSGRRRVPASDGDSESDLP